MSSDERQRDQICGDTKSEFDNSSISQNGFAISEINVNIVMIEKHLIKRVDGLVYGLLGRKE